MNTKHVFSEVVSSDYIELWKAPRGIVQLSLWQIDRYDPCNSSTIDSLELNEKSLTSLIKVLVEMKQDVYGGSDMVNNPKHYNATTTEVIDIIEIAQRLASNPRQNFELGNTIKYLARAPHKNKMEDLNKAMWYFNRLTESSRKDAHIKEEDFVTVYHFAQEVGAMYPKTHEAMIVVVLLDLILGGNSELLTTFSENLIEACKGAWS